MITKDYKPSMKPELVGDQIWITGEYLRSLKITDPIDQSVLKETLVGHILCPEKYGFRDTPKNRQLLGMGQPS